MRYFEYSPQIFAVTEFLSPTECGTLIELGKSSGFEPAPIRYGSRESIDTGARNNSRATVDDKELAATLWIRCSQYVPQEVDGWLVDSLNERFRIYRYDQYQTFRWHSDGRYARSDTEESKYTFMVYLNDDFEGGFTNFGDIKVYPATGMALCFRHALSHEGATVSRGTKYVLRTDVMYQMPTP